MDFPSRIVEIKSDKNLLQKDIATAIGVAVRQYQRYEKGEQQPTLPILIKLANFFDCSLDYLVGLSETKQRQP